MAIATVCSPYGSNGAMVDKRIGTAFKVVEAVHDKLNEISYVVENMEAIVAVAAMTEIEQSTTLMGIALAVGQEASIPYPTGVTNAKLRGFDVLIVDTLGTVHLPGEYYTAKITNGALKVGLVVGSPSALVGGTIRWRITYAS